MDLNDSASCAFSESEEEPTPTSSRVLLWPFAGSGRSFSENLLTTTDFESQSELKNHLRKIVKITDAIDEVIKDRPKHNSSSDTFNHNQIIKGPCSVCSISCRSRCGGCKQVYYCSKKHQQVHWSKHQPDCRPFSIPPQYPAGWCPRSSMGATGKANKTKEQEKSLELKYMVVNKEISGGFTLFAEKPLIITPNYPSNNIKINQCNKFCCCFGCYKQFSVVVGKGCGEPLDICKRCLIPLCVTCLTESVEQTYQSHDSLGHRQQECQAIADAVAKNRQFMIAANEHLGQNANLVKDYTILRVLQLQKSSLSKWESFISLRGNSRYIANVKVPTDDLKEWLGAEYPISDNYLKNIFKDKCIKLEEVIRLFAVFSDVSYFDPNVRVLYELRSWVPHSCIPNAEFHFKPGDTSQTLYLKAVETIRTDSIVTVNYMPDYEEGTSKTAIRLFNKTRLCCANTRCSCRVPRIDSTVGIRCNLFSGSRDTVVSCPGFWAPVLEPPNPDKPHLGMLIYVKSKTWSCNKCRKSEKFGLIQKQVKEVTEKIKKEVEEYCKFPNSEKYRKLNESLRKSVSEQHWLYWKVQQSTLDCWNKLLGSGNEMLSKFMSYPPGEAKNNILKMVSQKIEFYGSGIDSRARKPYEIDKNNKGILSLLAKRHGRLSLIRGTYLFDAFYSNLIVFAENFKEKLTIMLKSPSKTNDLITDTMRCWQILIKILQEASISLAQSETEEDSCKARMASEMLQIFESVYTKASRNRTSVLQYMRDFLEVYAYDDRTFIANTLSKLKPLNGNDIEEIEIDSMFDPEPRQYLNLTFGPVYGKNIVELNKRNEKNNCKKNNNRKQYEDVPIWKKDNLSSDSSAEEFEGSFGGSLDDNENLEDFFDFPMSFYEQLLNDSIRRRMVTEEILRNLSF